MLEPVSMPAQDVPASDGPVSADAVSTEEELMNRDGSDEYTIPDI